MAAICDTKFFQTMSQQKCQAANCKSKCRKTVKFFNFPSDLERKKLWIEVCERENENWFPTSRSQKLCQIHFSDEQFENRRVDGWRKLKWNAIPTIKTSMLSRSETATVKLEDPTYGIKTEPLYQGYEERLMTSAAPDRLDDIVHAPEPSCQICGRASDFYNDNLCKVCEKKFEFDQELNIQKKKNVRTVVKYQCDECLKKFSNLNMYQRHIKCHEEKKPYRCVCQKRFYHSRDLVLHMESHENASHSPATSQSAISLVNMSTLLTHDNSTSIMSGTANTYDTKLEKIDENIDSIEPNDQSAQFIKLESPDDVTIRMFENPYAIPSVVENFELFSNYEREIETMTNNVYHDESNSSHTSTTNSITEMNEFVLKEEPGTIGSITEYHSSLLTEIQFQREDLESAEGELKGDGYEPIVVLETVNQNQNEEAPRSTSGGRNISYICKHCQKDFMYFGNYAKHLEQHSVGKLMCKFCNQMFSSTYQIRKHIRDYHSNQEMFDCSVCFTTLPKHCFVSHMRTHRSDDKTLMCKYCGCQFCEPIELFHHFKNKHSDSTEPTGSINNERSESKEITETENGYKCKYCGMIFDDVLKMYHHAKVHIKNTSATKRLVQVTNVT